MFRVYEYDWDNLLKAILFLLMFAAITVVLEAPVVLAGFRKSEYKHKVRLMIEVNIFTNVILNAIISFFALHSDSQQVLIMEAVIVLVEALIYFLAIFDISGKRAFLVSLIANLFSYVVGSFIAFYFDLYDVIIDLVHSYRY